MATPHHDTKPYEDNDFEDVSKSDEEDDDEYDVRHRTKLPYAEATFTESLHIFIDHDICGCFHWRTKTVPPSRLDMRNLTPDMAVAMGLNTASKETQIMMLAPRKKLICNTLPGGFLGPPTRLDFADMCRGCGDRIDAYAKQTLLMEKEWYVPRRESKPSRDPGIPYVQWKSTHCKACVDKLKKCNPVTSICIGCHALLKDGKCPGTDFVPWYDRET